jgi:hypothetical protein
VLLNGTRWPVERFLAGLRDEAEAEPAPRDPVRGDLSSHLVAAGAAPGAVTTRLACLVEVRAAGDRAGLERGLERLEAEGQGGAGIDVLRAEAACLAGDLEAAFERARSGLDLAADHEVTVFRLRQVARIARAGGWPERALPDLREWLTRFPDAPDSGAVWLDRCVNAAEAGPDHEDDAAAALERARALLGESPVLEKMAGRLAARRAAAQLGAAAAG